MLHCQFSDRTISVRGVGCACCSGCNIGKGMFEWCSCSLEIKTRLVGSDSLVYPLKDGFIIANVSLPNDHSFIRFSVMASTSVS